MESREEQGQTDGRGIWSFLVREMHLKLEAKESNFSVSTSIASCTFISGKITMTVNRLSQGYQTGARGGLGGYNPSPHRSTLASIGM